MTWALCLWLMAASEPRGPITFAFLRGSGPEAGRERAYDPETRTYRLDVHDIARFVVRGVADDLEAKPVVLRIVGMLDEPEGPLELQVDGRRYHLAPGSFDPDLVRVERTGGVTTIRFLPGAKALLKPGATFQYIDYYRH